MPYASYCARPDQPLMNALSNAFGRVTSCSWPCSQPNPRILQLVLFQRCKSEQSEPDITAVLAHNLLDQMLLLADARPASLRLPVPPEKLARVQICLYRFWAILPAIDLGLAIHCAGLGAGEGRALRLARLLVVAQWSSACVLRLPCRIFHCFKLQCLIALRAV